MQLSVLNLRWICEWLGIIKSMTPCGRCSFLNFHNLRKLAKTKSVFFLRIWLVFKKKLPLRGIQKIIQKKTRKPLRGFRVQKRIAYVQKIIRIFIEKYHKSMFSGAARRPRERFDSLFTFSRCFLCFWAFQASEQVKNKILNTPSKKYSDFSGDLQKIIQKIIPKPLRGFRVQKRIAHVQKKIALRAILIIFWILFWTDLFKKKHWCSCRDTAPTC